MNKLIILIIFTAFAGSILAQNNYVEGKILGKDTEANSSKNLPIFGANVYWDGTTIGTTTNEQGFFKLERNGNKNSKLIISYIGFRNDTIAVDDNNSEINVVLKGSQQIDEVTVYNRQKGTYISKALAIQTETVTAAGLQKLPCCNLAESFENTATVDVGYADAVSGAKQIKMLGLAGKYSQILIEKKPAVRGLASNFGISYIPGSWMEAIQVSKGTSSVIDGYESVSGQINVEYKKPDTADPLHINMYGNSLGRMETNIIASKKLNENWSSMLLLTGGHNSIKHDLNNDNFIDLPLNTQLHVMNRWKYNSHKNYKGQFGVTYLNEDRSGGQLESIENTPSETNLYGIGIKTQRLDFFAKNGFFLPNKHQSIGMIVSGSYHDVDANYGNRNYTGTQSSFYGNFIFRTIIGNSNHNLNTGISFMYDDYDEQFMEMDMKREEIVAGVFSEYDYSNGENFNFIAGVRYDNNNLHGNLFTPRMHAKYNISDATIIRASVGKGYKSANIFSENPGIFASSRNIVIDDLDIEEAWNLGANLTHDLYYTDEKAISFSLDFYRTSFVNQVVVDMDRDLHNVFFYNLDGESFSNSYQFEISLEPIERFEISSAVRYNDVKITTADKLMEKPFVNKFKALLNLSYATNYNKWMFDANIQYNGKARLPEVLSEVPALEYDDYSPGFFMFQAQVTKKFRGFSVYLGGENLGNFIQENPIIAADNPFGDDFDASMVWGPIIGRRFFLGVRYTLK